LKLIEGVEETKTKDSKDEEGCNKNARIVIRKGTRNRV
jgi:hypothetical protein